MIQAKVIASTKEGYVADSEELFNLGGKVAGICYGRGDYFDPSVSSDEAGARRAKAVARDGHHSCFEHSYMTVEFKNIPKLIVMLLNSIGLYATSEKSARYTTMRGITDREEELYNSWQEKFKKLIAKAYPDMPEQMVEKMALENARYMLSVMVNTQLAYTTSYNNWCYLREWFKKLKAELEELDVRNCTYAIYKFYLSCCEMVDVIDSLGFSDSIKDPRNRNFEFIMGNHNIEHQYFGDTYCFLYDASLATLGQIERHRVSVCNIQTNKKPSSRYYVPAIIRGTEFEADWISDLESISDNIPQATMIKVAERGITERYAWKMRERLCGSAMNEIKDITANCLEQMVKSDNISPEIRKQSIELFTDEAGKAIPRCKTGAYVCTRKCFYGPENAISRKV